MTTLLLCLIDGMRPDGLQAARTPVIDSLVASGVSTMEAGTVMPSITLPCITSLFLSAPPSQHGVTTNTWSAQGAGPGLVEVLAQAGLTSAFFYNWEPLRDLSRPGALQASVFIKGDSAPEDYADAKLTEEAARYLQAARRARRPFDFAFVYLGNTDAVGHRHGWMSGPYLAAIENADACIGTLLEAVDGEARIIVTSDHGGHATAHGSDAYEDMTIPIVLAGHKTFQAGRRLTKPASILDIAPTVARWLGVAPDPAWLGEPIALGPPEA